MGASSPDVARLLHGLQIVAASLTRGVRFRRADDAADLAGMNRRRLLPVLASLLALAFVPGALADDAPPTVTLLSPTDAAAVRTDPGTFVTFTWRVDWASPTDTTVTWQIASDPGFTQDVVSQSQPCPAANVNCFNTTQPQTVHTEPRYWRVGVTTAAGTVYSPTFGFRPFVPDTDKDGVFDSRDNCPSVANAKQTNSDGTSAGDACEADRFAPRVSVKPATVQRGVMGRMYFQMTDARGTVRYTTSLYRGSRRLVTVSETMKNVSWKWLYYLPLQFPKAMPTGVYRLCIKVADPRGNSARSCNRLTIR
jgi:hypothetical protein